MLMWLSDAEYSSAVYVYGYQRNQICMDGPPRAKSISQWSIGQTSLYYLYHRVHESGNGRFLAYIPSRLKNQPSLVRVGGARPPPFTLFTITYKIAVYAPAEWACTYSLHSPYFISINICTLWRRVMSSYSVTAVHTQETRAPPSRIDNKTPTLTSSLSPASIS